MLPEKYLQDPCRLSVPYWKDGRITVPENMKIIHQQAFDSRMGNDYTDERYFRLLHPLKNVRNQRLVNALLCRMQEADFATVSGKVDSFSNPERLYRRCGFQGEDIRHVLTVKRAEEKRGSIEG
ncbi:MAG: hypothetical protein HFG27_12855 [Provencibacterium sp.]|jgi:hypothetical protein|nr:hypothetical protein [Provencibacterium sp.]